MLKNLAARFNNLSISRRLAVGFAVLVGLVALAGLTNLVAFRIESQVSQRASHADDEARLAEQIDNELLQARQFEKNFLLRWRDEGFETAYNAYFSPYLERMQSIQELIAQQRAVEDEVEADEAFDELEQTTQEAAVLFTLLIDQLGQRGFVDTGLEGKLREDTQTLQESSAFAVNPDLQITLLEMRRNEKDYLLRGLPVDIGDTQNFALLLRSQIRALALPAEEQDALIARVDSYLLSFGALVELDQKIAADLERLDSLDAAVDPIIDDAVEDGEQERAAAELELTNIRQISQTVDIAVLAFAFFVGVVLSVVIRRSIVGPLTELTETASGFAEGDLARRAPVTSRDEVGVLGTVFNTMADQLQDLIGSLEGRVAARTADLASSIEVGALATAIRSQEELLPQITEFIRSRFDLYYAQVYLLDEARRYAILRSGTGEIGQQLVARGHRLDIAETSLVATAVQTGEPVLVPNTETSQIHRKNPLLPDTRSEVSIPLIVNNEIIGVLDMQAARAEAFNDENLPVFRSMANQLAAALRAAQAYDETQTAVARAEQINRRLTVEAWEPYLDKLAHEGRLGYLYDLEMPRPLDERLSASAESGDLVQPLTLRGQQIGALRIKDDHERVWTNEEMTLVEDVSERVAQALEQLRSFDEVKEAEANVRAALRQTEELQGALDEAAIVAVTDQTGRIVYANDNFCRISKYSREELLGQDHRLINSGVHSKEFIRDMWVTIANGGVWHGEFCNRAKDGSLYWVDSTIVPFFNEEGKPRQYVSIRYEITERKRVEAEISKRADELETVAQVSAATTATLDMDALLQAVTDVTKERFDLYHAHVYLLDDEQKYLRLAAGAGDVGRAMKARRHAIPYDREASLVATAARTRRAVVVNDVTEEPNFLPNPMLPDTRSEMALPLIVSDTMLGVLDVQSDRVGYFTDDEMRVKAVLADQIAVAVQNARAYEAQRGIAERLREVDRLKSEFLANMSHELRTPLNSIIGYSEVLLDGIDGDLGDEAMEDVRAIHGSGQHLLNIINDILDLAKIEAGQMRIDRRPLELNPYIRELVQTAQILTKDKPVTLEVIEEAPNLIVKADPIRLRQIVWNLLSNAVKFTEQGTVTVYLTQDERGQALVKVADTGVGIKSEDQPLLFEQFRQVDGSSTRRAGGTGLGLHITRHLVRMHQGDIHVESEFGTGSTFWFTVPLYVEETAGDKVRQ